jgi:hypothetical protein
MKKILTFLHENIEITVQVLSLEVEREYNNLQNHITAVNCQLLIKNEKETEREGSPCYMLVGSDRIPLPAANADDFKNITEIDGEIFVPIIQEYVSSNPSIVDRIKLNGSILGLCDPPERIQYAAAKMDKRKKNGGLVYDERGIAVMEIR